MKASSTSSKAFARCAQCRRKYAIYVRQLSAVAPINPGAISSWLKDWYQISFSRSGAPMRGPMPGYTKSKKNIPTRRSGALRASGCIAAPPTSWPTTPTRPMSSAPSSACTSAAWSSGPNGPAGLSLSPNPRKSGAISRKRSASRVITGSQVSQNSGQPCRRISGRPRPVRATWKVAPLAWIVRCSMACSR